MSWVIKEEKKVWWEGRVNDKDDDPDGRDCNMVRFSADFLIVASNFYDATIFIHSLRESILLTREYDNMMKKLWQWRWKWYDEVEIDTVL